MNHRRWNGIANLGNLFFFVTGNDKVTGKSLNLFEFIGNQAPRIGGTTGLFETYKKPGLMIVGTDNGLTGPINVNNLRVNWTIALRTTQEIFSGF
jgi:hypothetical protein